MDTHPNYRSFLRVVSVVTACVLVFQSGLVDERSPQLFNQAGKHLSASVGMSVGVAPTEYNTITAELTKQQNLLAEREVAVAEREIAVELSTGDTSNDNRVTYLLAAALFVQLVLIVLNYGLDYVRMRDRKELMAGVRTSG